MKHLYEKFSFQGQAWVSTLKGNISRLEYKMLEKEESRGRGNHQSDGHDPCQLPPRPSDPDVTLRKYWYMVHCALPRKKLRDAEL